jgi:hypothetical protein
MTWTPHARVVLEALYKQGFSDEQIATQMNSTAYAIGRKRSELGLVKYKVAKHSRATKTVKPVEKAPECIMHYKDGGGVDHYMNGEIESLKMKATPLMQHNKVKEIILYKPFKKLIIQHVKEVDL